MKVSTATATADSSSSAFAAGDPGASAAAHDLRDWQRVRIGEQYLAECGWMASHRTTEGPWRITGYLASHEVSRTSPHGKPGLPFSSSELRREAWSPLQWSLLTNPAASAVFNNSLAHKLSAKNPSIRDRAKQWYSE